MWKGYSVAALEDLVVPAPVAAPEAHYLYFHSDYC